MPPIQNPEQGLKTNEQVKFNGVNNVLHQYASAADKLLLSLDSIKTHRL